MGIVTASITIRAVSTALIDLTKGYNGDATALPLNELIHQSQFTRISNLFDKQYKLACQDKSDIDEHNNTISVFAKRGYGKTTFVKSFLDYVSNEEKYNCCCLHIIDPSMLELKQHPFIHVLSMIQEQVDLYVDSHDAMCSPMSDKYAHYTEWLRAYKKLRCSLSVLDCVGDSNFYKDWDNAEHIAKIGMKQAADANNIRKHFVQYLNESLKIINKKCFLLVFDDIDTNFRKGFEILETIRKYLSVLKVITVMTGDINLYSKLIRQNLWTGFNNTYLSLEKDNVLNSFSEIANLIDQLEEQYLLKILKPENRITLTSVLEKLKGEEPNVIKVKYKAAQDIIEEELPKIYERLCNQLGFTSKSKHADEIENFIMCLPFRTQMRIITAFCKIPKNFLPGDIVQNIVGIFQTDISLKSNKMDGDALSIDNFGKILDFLLHQNVLASNANFMPDNADMTLNKALFAIGAVANKKLRENFYLWFDYWMRISYVKMCFSKEKYKEMLALSRINSDKNLNKAYCQSHAFYNMKMVKFDGVASTMIPLPAVYRIADYGQFASAFNANPLIGLALFETRADSENSTCFVSFYKLLASLGDILKVDIQGNKEEEKKKIGYSLNICSQFRTYLEPDNNAPETRRDMLETGKNDYTLASFNFQDKADEIFTWLKNYEKPQSISTGFLDRIFVRTYYAISELDQEDFKNVGDKFNAMVIAFLNAVLVEEALDKGFVDINISSRDNILLVFFNNVENFYSKKSLVLFRFISSCPLLEGFMDPYYRNLMCLVRGNVNQINIQEAVMRRSLMIRKGELEQDLKTYKAKGGQVEEQLMKTTVIKRKLKECNKEILEEEELNKKKEEIMLLLINEDIPSLPKTLISDFFISSDNTTLLKHLDDIQLKAWEEYVSVNVRKKNCELNLNEVSQELSKVEKSAFNGSINIDYTKESLYKSLCAIKLL